MTAFKPQQRQLTIRGRRFHFVSREGRPANHRRAQLAYPAMWYLMVEGRRCPVLPCDSSKSLPELDAALRDWAEDNALGPVEGTPSPPSAISTGGRCQGNWRGPN
jgi:hypothetical protein